MFFTETSSLKYDPFGMLMPSKSTCRTSIYPSF